MNNINKQVILSIVLYCAVGSALTVVNKLLMASFPFPNIVALIQCSATIVLIRSSASQFKSITGNVETLDINMAVSWIPLILCFVGMLSSSMYALKYVSVSTLIVVRNLTTLVIAFSDIIWLRSTISRKSVLCLLLMVVGSSVYGWHDLSFNATGYMFLGLNVLTTSAYQIYIKILMRRRLYNSFTMAYFNNTLSVPLFVLLGVLQGDFAASEEKLRAQYPVLLLLLSSVLSFGVSVSGFLLNHILSATSIMVVNNVNKFILILFSELVLQPSIDFWSGLGCVFVLLSALFYSKFATEAISDSNVYRLFRGMKHTKVVMYCVCVCAIALVFVFHEHDRHSYLPVPYLHTLRLHKNPTYQHSWKGAPDLHTHQSGQMKNVEVDISGTLRPSRVSVSESAPFVAEVEERVNKVIPKTSNLHLSSGDLIRRAPHDVKGQGSDCVVNKKDYSFMDAVLVNMVPGCSTTQVVQRLFRVYSFRKVFFIAKSKSFCPYIESMDARMVCMQEDDLMPGVTYQGLDDRSPEIKKFQGVSNRVGWYYAMFLKIGVGHFLPGLSDYYLVWDSDNIPLEPIDFFTKDGRMNFCANPMGVKPAGYVTGYGKFHKMVTGYDMLRPNISGKLVQDPKEPVFNFVCGYIVGYRPYATELIEHITAYMKKKFPSLPPRDQSYPWNILALANVAIKENYYWADYDSYPSWVAQKHPERYNADFSVHFLRNPGLLIERGIGAEGNKLQRFPVSPASLPSTHTSYIPPSILHFLSQCCMPDGDVCAIAKKHYQGKLPHFLIWEVRAYRCLFVFLTKMNIIGA
mmetsp:Transcript_26505/g.84872  ORF Transcript_26505/g.84872 Transcript_26505/m.84872 type:complete len:802 (+) Transcript_26505:329-2734(+)